MYNRVIFHIEWYSGSFRSPESFFILGGNMKQHKTNEELLDYLKNKSVIIKNKKVYLLLYCK